MRKLLQFLFILVLGVFCCACVNNFAVHELNQKAFKYMEMGDNSAAISRLEASIDLDGENYHSRYNLANAYLSTGRFEDAIQHAKKAAELNKREPIAHYTLGVAATNAAENLFKHKDKDGKMVEVEFNNPKDEQDALNKYKEYIKLANFAFNEYLSLVPHAEDAQSVMNTINDNTDKLQQKLNNGYNN